MNNFDRSSSGVNLELSCFWDLDLARIYFNESFTLLHSNSDSMINPYSRVNVYQYTDYGNLPEIDLNDINEYQFTTKELYQALLAIIDHDELREYAREYHGKSFSKCNKSELIDIAENTVSTYDFDYLLSNFTLKHEIISSRGYCQDDYVEVIIHNDYWQGINKTDKALNNLSDTIDHLFWDSPLYCRLEVDNEEIYLDGNLLDQYTYDENVILEIANKAINHDKKKYILEWLKENLPTNPDYR